MEQTSSWENPVGDNPSCEDTELFENQDVENYYCGQNHDVGENQAVGKTRLWEHPVAGKTQLWGNRARGKSRLVGQPKRPQRSKKRCGCQKRIAKTILNKIKVIRKNYYTF